MAEYIEREALLGSIGLIQLHFVAHGDNKSLYDIINEQPAADVYTEEEVRDAYTDGFSEGMAQGMEKAVVYGRWEWREEWETHHETHSVDLISCGWHCTECGIELGEYLTEKTGQHIILDDDCCKPELTICPNCGAKMDAEVKT